MPVCVMTTEYYKDEIKMEKQLKDLIAAIDAKRVVGSLDKRIVEVTNDSRQAREGSLFIAVRGAVVDAHQFIPAVVAAGAVVTENVPPKAVVAGCPARFVKWKDEKTAGKTGLTDGLR